MKPTVSPRTVVFLILGLLSPLAAANQEAQPNPARHAPTGSKSAAAATEFHLPAPVATRKPSTRTSGPADQEGRGILRTRSVQRKVNADRLTTYEIEPDSLAKGLAAVSAAYRKLPAR